MIKIARRRVVITCNSGRTIIGECMIGWPFGAVRVRAAKMLERGAGAADLSRAPHVDGILVVPRHSIDYMQVI